MQVDCFFDGDVAVIYLQDQFDLRESKGFHGAIDAIVDDANVREIEVNLSRFEHMDSPPSLSYSSCVSGHVREARLLC